MKNENKNIKEDAKKFFDAITVNLSSSFETIDYSPARIKKLKDAWVPWGVRNDMPDQLIKLEDKSTIHQAFIKLKQDLIFSEGLSYDDVIKGFIEKINEYGETGNDILEAVAVDLAILETFGLMVRYNKQKTKAIAIDYVDSSKIRVDKNLDEFGRIKGYWVCADWTNVRDNVPQYFEAFNTDKIGNTTQLYYYKRHKKLGQPYYGNISYLAAATAIETHYKLNDFLANTISNGFYSSAIVEINSEATAEQKQSFIQNFIAKNTGSENAGKVTFVWTSQPNSVKINPINPSDITPMLQESRKITSEEIISAHGGQSILIGVTQEGNGLGSDGNLYNVAFTKFYDSTIRKVQKPFLDFLKKVLDFNGFGEYELEIKSSALLMDSQTKQDLLKPEAFITDYGYAVEDLKDYDEAAEPENNTPEIDGTDTDEPTEDTKPVL